MAVKPVEIKLDYTPRAAFLPFHARTKRYAAIVSHRRAGKTVASLWDMLLRALQKPGNYAYLAPFRSQAKSVAWEYLKDFTRDVRRTPPNESELRIELINGSRISLFGADNADALRGLGFSGAIMDEHADMAPSVLPAVVRPTLADKSGWLVVIGTPRGHNPFYQLYREAVADPDRWYSSLVPAHKVDDGINAVRMTFPRLWFDRAKCKDGLEALAQYKCDYDEKLKTFKTHPRHDWTSHAADAMRYLAMAWRELLGGSEPIPPPDFRPFDEWTYDEFSPLAAIREEMEEAKRWERRTRV